MTPRTRTPLVPPVPRGAGPRAEPPQAVQDQVAGLQGQLPEVIVRERRYSVPADVSPSSTLLGRGAVGAPADRLPHPVDPPVR